jgi:hypothetical protein
MEDSFSPSSGVGFAFPNGVIKAATNVECQPLQGIEDLLGHRTRQQPILRHAPSYFRSARNFKIQKYSV